MFKIHEHAQGSEAWFQARLGKLTGSIASDIITRAGKKSASADEVVNRAVAEIIMQRPDETFQSDSMLRGKDLEDQALEFFNFVNGYQFVKCGFMEAIDENGKSLGFGASPDGLDLPIKMGLELKCPEAHTHLGYLASRELPKKYFHQVQTAMMVSDFDKWVFGSYHPSLPCFKVEVPRDEAFILLMRPMFLEVAQMIQEKLKIVTELVKAS